MKTSRQIQGDIYRMLKDSILVENLSGKVYRGGTRPRDSRLEDAVVIFTTGTAEEIQSGVVTINIYVPDVDPYENGVLVEDIERTEEVERLAAEWVNDLTADKSDYKFELQQTIWTEEDTDINQHFVVIKLRYDLYEKQ